MNETRAKLENLIEQCKIKLYWAEQLTTLLSDEE